MAINQPTEAYMETTLAQVKNILYATDLSKQTVHAFNYAAGLAAQYGASLTILFVMEDTPQVHSQDFKDFLGKERWEEVRKSHDEEIRRLLIGKKREGAMIRQALGEMLTTAQGSLEGQRPDSDQIVVAQGPVVDCIVEEIKARGIDLVVMGYHARGRLEEAVSGSVSRSVLRKVHVPVLLVKLPEEN
jgi:nucleotide-binding universal stress UspA family protein